MDAYQWIVSGWSGSLWREPGALPMASESNWCRSPARCFCVPAATTVVGLKETVFALAGTEALPVALIPSVFEHQKSTILCRGRPESQNCLVSDCWNEVFKNAIFCILNRRPGSQAGLRRFAPPICRHEVQRILYRYTFDYSRLWVSAENGHI